MWLKGPVISDSSVTIPHDFLEQLHMSCTSSNHTLMDSEMSLSFLGSLVWQGDTLLLTHVISNAWVTHQRWHVLIFHLHCTLVTACPESSPHVLLLLCQHRSLQILVWSLNPCSHMVIGVFQVSTSVFIGCTATKAVPPSCRSACQWSSEPHILDTTATPQPVTTSAVWNVEQQYHICTKYSFEAISSVTCKRVSGGKSHMSVPCSLSNRMFNDVSVAEGGHSFQIWGWLLCIHLLRCMRNQ